MRNLVIILMVATLLASGCSGGSAGNIALPCDMPVKSGLSHGTWGVWQFIADPTSGTLDAVQLRSLDMHLNALHFLEPPPLAYLTIESLKFIGNIIEADIGLKHPFLGLTEFTGFDVCGIVITNGNVTGFSDPTLRMAGNGDTRLLNPDGYSRWWNPAEFPHGNTMFNYKDGLLGAPDSSADYNSTLNAYKYFCDDLATNDPITAVTLAKRGMFAAGKKNVRHYTIELGAAGLIFNYAVDACWAYPSGSSPWTAPDDFPPAANRPESWRIAVTETKNTLWNDGTNSGGDLKLSIDVYDWYNAALNSVNVESPTNFTPVTSTAPLGGGTGYSTYEIEILNAAPAAGSINLLISVASEVVGYGNLLPGKPVTAYFTRAVAVANEPPITPTSWTRTWGGLGKDYGNNVTVDGSGCSYVTGYFQQTVDFDPGTGGDIRTSMGGDDVFLSKFDPSGNFIWAKTWGGPGMDQGCDITLDTTGNIYVTGLFVLTVDFDPGTDVDNHSAIGGADAFLSKFDSSGKFMWARTWGGSKADNGLSVVVDGSETVYISGLFEDEVDFDPGPMKDPRTSNGIADVFLSKFDSSGNYSWVKAWGGAGLDQGYSIDLDSAGSIYVAGAFSGSVVDFDPGSGVDNHTTSGSYDAFLSKFDSSGGYLWARTWGGYNYDYAWGVVVDGSNNAYVTGYFYDKVDFDPGTGEDWHTSNGIADVFLVKYSPTGNYIWGNAWGGTERDIGWNVSVDGLGNVYVTGYFQGSADFDPGTAVDFHYSNGSLDVFLSKFDSSGKYSWAMTWGATLDDSAYGLALDTSQSIYISGCFMDTVDFDPGPEEDWHTSNGSSDVFLSKFIQ